MQFRNKALEEFPASYSGSLYNYNLVLPQSGGGLRYTAERCNETG